ncbi:ATP-dependent nuclease [Azonexus hydrophilus]|uniref:ATP-dependent nuclease n=1 Tax=Azonexus hydrophilus TaxID=418702 RepID=UPI00041693AF|nr:AAA family ATPase [Azonexus hydrophilus]
MSIRAAKFGDYWRIAFARNYTCRYLTLEYSGLKPLLDDNITFSPGITAIVGGNGVGKSTLAHAIADVLAGASGVSALRDINHRLIGCTLRATLQNGNNDPLHPTLSIIENARKGNTQNHQASFIWLDPSSMSTLCQKQILHDPTFSEILDGVAPRALTTDELAFASYLVGKEYSECIIWEVEDYGPFEAWPYFQATCNGITYRSESMGQGEISLLTALWAIVQAPKDSIVVFEEPETHVSARSQSAFMDTLAWACATKGLWAILTTHSPVILKRLPANHIRLLVNNGGRSSLVENPKLHNVAAIVGGGAAFKCLLLVEDECAKYFAQFVLEELDPDLGRQCSFTVMDGEAKISQILNNLPSTSDWISLIGCFDGDLRGSLNSDGFYWPFVYLPGSVAPELLLKQCIQANSPNDLAAELRMDASTVSVALATVTGIDHHDWLNNLVGELGRTAGEVVRAMVRIWLRAEHGAAIQFVEDLKRSFG